MVFSKLIRCPHCKACQVGNGEIISLRPLKASFNCKQCHKNFTQEIIKTADKELQLIELNKKL